MAAVTEHSAETKKLKNKARASLALLLIAVISISTATYAWFTLSNSTSVQSMVIEVGTGTTLKAYAGNNSTDSNIDNYFAIIKSEGTTESYTTGEIITDALPKKGTAFPNLTESIKSLSEIKLWPVTSGNGVKHYTEGLNTEGTATGSGPEKKYYVHLTLTFISDTTMDVYLNGTSSSTDVEDSTLVQPGVTLGQAKPGGGTYSQADVDAARNAVKALRISFESVDEFNNPVYAIYEPDNTGASGSVETTTLNGNARKDLQKLPGMSSATVQQTFTTLGDNTGRNTVNGETPAVFSLVANEPKVVTIRMWVEGEDKQCINDSTKGVNIEKALLNVRFRFCGADPTTGDFIETAPR